MGGSPMSTTKLFQIGLVTTMGVAGLALTANAQSRYGNIYDYESGRNCGQSCVAPAAAATTRYGTPVTQAPTYNPAPIYVDCTQTGTCAPQATTVYTQPAPVYTQPAPVYAQADTYSSGTSYASEPVSCPAGTTAQSDGTCLQSGSSFSTGTTYSEPTPSYSSGSTYSEPTPSYSSGTSYAAEAVSCPAGTTAQADGTCLQSGSSFTGSTVELYQGDASSNTNSSTGYGYTGGSYNAGDYLPVRK